MKKAIFLILVLTSGCRAPDYITSQCAHIYYNCADPDHDFPTNDEVELMLDHMIEHAHKCGPMAAENITAILSNMDINLQCHGPSGKHYDKYFRDQIYVEWSGYGRIWTLYHEIMHPLYRYYRGGTDRDHLDEDYWAGATCLVRLFELCNGWSV
jgi:hypothetical protein